MPFNLTFGRLPNNGDAFGTVYSVNGKTGNVELVAADIGAASEQYVDERIAEIPTAQVQSVNGKTGAVIIDANDVGAEHLGSVANLKSYVDSENSELRDSISTKASKEYVDQQDQLLQEQIDLKANAQAVNQALSTKADLDESGKVPASQLPSYVDDVLDGRYVNPSQFNDLNGIPYTPESGKVYVDVDTNKTYRWSGMLYVVIGGGGVALGETSETAYRGDRGKIAYDHSQSQGNPHNSTTSDIPEGTRQYFTPLRVRSTDLTGYTLGTNNPITAADTVVSAFGQAQAQISGIINSFQSNVRGTLLTGLNTNLTGDVDASQNFLTAIGRFQGKFNALGGTIRNTTLNGLDVSNKNAVIPSDLLVVGMGKLQGQIDDLKSGVVWVNVKTLAGIYWHSSIDVANTTIELAKINGQLWLRGWIRSTANLPSNIPIVLWTQSSWQVDVSGLGLGSSYYYVAANISVTSSVSSTTPNILSCEQQLALLNNGTFLKLNATFVGAGIFGISMFCLGRAL